MSSVLRLDEPQLPCICTSFSRFERLFISFTQFGGSFHCLNFVKFREDYRAFHKLLGNFVATSRISSNFMYSEQFLQLSSNSEISDRDRGGGGAGRAIALPLLLLGFIS